MRNIEKKIDWEYEKFYLDMMRTSRENIFTKSKEIEYKKCICKKLKEVTQELSENEINVLMVKDNLIDYMFTFLNEKQIVTDNDIQKQLNKLLGRNNNDSKTA